MVRGFVLTDYGQTKLYEIPLFKMTGLVSHGFSTRVGGTGESPYQSLNLALHVGDNPKAVVENRKIICGILGTNIDQLVAAEQIHGANIEVVGEEHAGSGALTYETAFPGTDGLITDKPGLLLATFYADCVPIFILDPVKKVIGSVHAGWKGTVARIGAVALKKMQEVYGSCPEDCLIGIGPSIGPCCYEVDKVVTDRLRGEFSWWTEVVDQTGDKSHLNLWATNERIMLEAGVKKHNIAMANTCTCCNQELLFSYRGSKGSTGRMGAFIMLRPVLDAEEYGANE